MSLGNIIKGIYNAIRPACVTWQSIRIKDKEIIFSVYFKGGQRREIKKRIIQRYNMNIKDFQVNFNYSLARLAIQAIQNEPKIKNLQPVREVSVIISLDRKIPMQYHTGYLKHGILLIFFDLDYVCRLVNGYRKFKFDDKKAFLEFGRYFKKALSIALEPWKITSSPFKENAPSRDAKETHSEIVHSRDAQTPYTPIVELLGDFIWECFDRGLKRFKEHEMKEIEIDCKHFLSFREGFSRLNFEAKDDSNDKEFLRRINVKENKSAIEDAGKIGLVICALKCLSFLRTSRRDSEIILLLNNEDVHFSYLNQIFSKRQTFSIGPMEKGVYSWIYGEIKQNGFEGFFEDYYESCDTLGIHETDRIIPFRLSHNIGAMLRNA